MAYPTLTANSPVAGSISWTAFSMSYKGVTYAVAAGSTAAAWVAWIYNSGVPQVVTNNTKPTTSATTAGTVAGWSGSTPVIGPDDLLMFGNRAGVPMDVQRTQIITGDLVATGTIVASNIATNAITATQIAANTITAAQIAAGTITANEIAANTITGAKIAANTITGDKIQAGSITAADLTIGNLRGNLVLNGNFEDIDSTAHTTLVWRNNFLGGTGTASNTTLNASTVIDGSVSGYLSGNADLTSNAFPVAAGQTYYVAAVVRPSTAAPSVSLVVTFGATQGYTNATKVGNTPTVSNSQVIDSSNNITLPSTNATAGTAYVVNNWTSGSSGAVYILSGQVTVPVGATWASVSVNTASGTINVDNVQFNAVVISAHIADGAIDGQIIRTDPTGVANQQVVLNSSTHAFEVWVNGHAAGSIYGSASAFDNIMIQSGTASLQLFGGGGGGAFLNAGAGYLNFTGQVIGNWVPGASAAYDIGSSSNRWNNVWCVNAAGTGHADFSGGYVMITSAHTYTNDWTGTLPTIGGGSTTYLVNYVDGTAVSAIAGNTRVNAGTKTFVIDHPTDKSKYLVHGAIEGPESAVFYRGRGQLVDGCAEIHLPDYFTALCDESTATVHVTPIAEVHKCGYTPCYPSDEVCNGHTEVANLVASPPKDGVFAVGRAAGFTEGNADSTEFTWLVMATRRNEAFEVEPSKSEYSLHGDGPYTYLVKGNGDGSASRRG